MIVKHQKSQSQSNVTNNNSSIVSLKLTLYQKVKVGGKFMFGVI